MKSWIDRTNNMPKYFYNLKLRYYDLNCKNIKYESYYTIQTYKEMDRNVICDNIIFKSTVECAKYYNVNREKLKHYLNKYCKMDSFFIIKIKIFKYVWKKISINIMNVKMESINKKM